MGFLDSLRMNGIFPQGDRSNLLGPQMEPDNSVGIFQGMLRAANPFIEGQQQAAREHERVMAGMNPVVNTPNMQNGPQPNNSMPQRPMLGQIGNRMSNPYNLTNESDQPKNVIFKDSDPTGMIRQKRFGIEDKDTEFAKEIAKGKLGVDRQEANVKGHLAQIQEFKAKHPNMVIKETKGGNFIAVNPLDGSTIDTGVPSGTLSDEDKLKITGKQKVDVAATKASTDKDAINLKAKNAKELSDSKGGQIFNIQDPVDPTKTIAVRTNPNTGKTERVKLDDTDVSGVAKPGSKGATNTNPAYEAVKTKAQETLDVLDQILDPKSGKLTDNAQSAVGLSSIFNRIPATSGRAGKAAINQLVSKLTLGVMGEMKAQSKTGATGFGALNMKELGVLEDAASQLKDTGLDEETYEKQAGIVKKYLKKIMDNSANEKGSGTKTDYTNMSPADLVKEFTNAPTTP